MARVSRTSHAAHDRLMTGRLTTHVLDTAHGTPGAGMAVRLFRIDSGTPEALAQFRTNREGRCDRPLLEGAALRVGRYRLVFSAGDYFRALGLALPDPPFVDEVTVDFGVADADAHYHVPLLVSPWSHATYRGS